MSSLYYIADHTNICHALQSGIWHEHQLLAKSHPITNHEVLLIKKDGTEASATDIKLQKYVRLVFDCAQYLQNLPNHFDQYFIIEVNKVQLDRCSDTMEIIKLNGGQREYIKNIQVDISHFLKIHVFSTNSQRKLRQACSYIPVAVSISTELFGRVSVLRSAVDFTITQPETRAVSSSEPPPVAVTLIKGNLFASHMQTIVNTVNCVGVMGKGIALAFKNKFPDMYEDYKSRCNRREVRTGYPYLYRSLTHQIILFPTKEHWRENSKLTYVTEGLAKILENKERWNLQSLAIPPLGCGNGKLDWGVVRPIMVRELSKLGIPVEIYVPHSSDSFRVKGKKRPVKAPPQTGKRRKLA